MDRKNSEKAPKRVEIKYKIEFEGRANRLKVKVLKFKHVSKFDIHLEVQLLPGGQYYKCIHNKYLGKTSSTFKDLPSDFREKTVVIRACAGEIQVPLQTAIFPIDEWKTLDQLSSLYGEQPILRKDSSYAACYTPANIAPAVNTAENNKASTYSGRSRTRATVDTHLYTSQLGKQNESCANEQSPCHNSRCQQEKDALQTDKDELNAKCLELETELKNMKRQRQANGNLKEDPNSIASYTPANIAPSISTAKIGKAITYSGSGKKSRRGIFGKPRRHSSQLETRNAKVFTCNIKSPPSQVTSIHHQIVQMIKSICFANGYEFRNGGQNPTLVTVVSSSRAKADIERDMNAAKLTSSESTNVILLRIIPVRDTNQRVEKICGENFILDLTFLADTQSPIKLHDCKHNEEQSQELMNYLSNQ